MKTELINQIVKIIGNQDVDEKEMLYRLRKVLYAAEIESINVKESRDISSLVSENLNLLLSGKQSERVIPTGFDAFEKHFGGFSLGEFVIIGGRPSIGKTLLLVSLALNISVTTPVLYFTYDLTENVLASRFISALTNISVDKLLQDNLSEVEKRIIRDVESGLSSHKIFINESCENSMSAFKEQCVKQIEENGVKVILVDYLQLMSSNKYRNNRELEVTHVCRELRNIAKDHQVCVIATSQLSRAVETRGGDRRPTLPDLRESGSLEQFADKVIFVYRPDYYGIIAFENGESATGITELIMAKNKNGRLENVKLMRNSNNTRYIDFDQYTHHFSFEAARLKEADLNDFGLTDID